MPKEVRKCLTTMAGSRSFIDWQGIRVLASDLETQRQAIMALAEPVFGRCDDSNGIVSSGLR